MNIADGNCSLAFARNVNDHICCPRGKVGVDIGGGQDECDEKRVVLKTFYGWQTVDAVKANREKRRGAKGVLGGSGGGRKSDGRGGREDDAGGGGSRRGSGTRWWSPNGRRSGSSSPPIMTDIPNDGCRTM